MNWFKDSLATAAKWFFLGIGVSGIQKVRLRADLEGLPTGRGWEMKSLSAEKIVHLDRESFRLKADGGEGACWLKGVNFPTGEVEVEISISSLPIGLAFHVRDERNFEAIVIRTASDGGRSRCVAEYVVRPRVASRPEHRAEIEGLKQGMDGFFHARLVIERDKLLLVIDRNNVPSLRIMEPGRERIGGSVGFLVWPSASPVVTGFKIKEVIRHVRV